jgi:hypothetical protein
MYPEHLPVPQDRRIIFKEFRRGLVRRFPYAVFDEYVDDKVIVYCIMHTARDPQKWRERLS